MTESREWKLHYHKLKGRGEYVRLMFEAARVPYIEINDTATNFSLVDSFALKMHDRLGSAEYPVFATPYVTGPNGFAQGQTIAICARLGKLFGFFPDNDNDEFHALQIAISVADFHNDGRQVFHPIDHYGSYYIQTEEAKPTVKAFTEKRFAHWLKHLEHSLSANVSNSGYFVGAHMTYCDLMVFHVLNAAEFQFPEAWTAIAPSIPKLIEFKRNIGSFKPIAEYLKSDRLKAFEGNSMM